MRRLYAWPHTGSITPMAVLPDKQGCYQDFLHPSAVESLGAHLAAPEVLSALQLQQYSIQSVELHLRKILGRPPPSLDWHAAGEVSMTDLSLVDTVHISCSLIHASSVSSKYAMHIAALIPRPF